MFFTCCQVAQSYICATFHLLLYKKCNRTANGGATMTVSDLFQIAAQYAMPSYSLPCPDIGDFAHTFEPLELLEGQFVQHTFYFAASVLDCLSKQVALHRWMRESEVERV